VGLRHKRPNHHQGLLKVTLPIGQHVQVVSKSKSALEEQRRPNAPDLALREHSLAIGQNVSLIHRVSGQQCYMVLLLLLQQIPDLATNSEGRREINIACIKIEKKMMEKRI